MKTLETNDWMVLNSIIYKIHTTQDSTTMRRQLLEQMKVVMEFDSADFYLAARGERSRLASPVRYNCEEATALWACYESRNYNRRIIDRKSVV